MLILLGYFLAICMGFILGLLGAGGAILSLPILVYCLQVPVITATGYSLLLVGLTAFIGCIGYYKKKQIRISIVLGFGIPSLIAVYFTRFWLLPALPDPLFTLDTYEVSKSLFILLLFSLLTTLSGIAMIRGRNVIHPVTLDKKIRWFLNGLEGIVVGVFTGLIGAGGGFLIVPALVFFAGLSMKVAIGSSLLIITLKSLAGFVGDLQVGIQIDYMLLILFLLCTTIGILLGSRLSKYVSDKILKRMFGWFTLMMGVIIVVKELYS